MACQPLVNGKVFIHLLMTCQALYQVITVFNQWFAKKKSLELSPYFQQLNHEDIIYWVCTNIRIQKQMMTLTIPAASDAGLNETGGVVNSVMFSDHNMVIIRSKYRLAIPLPPTVKHYKYQQRAADCSKQSHKKYKYHTGAPFSLYHLHVLS